VSRWLLDFAGDGDGSAGSAGIAGFVRLELREVERIAWFWTYLVGVPDVEGLIVVRDHEVLLPRQGLEIRADGLWADLWCEAPREHWTLGLESFGVRLDEPDEALRPGGEIGERIAVGLDLEWEVGAGGPPEGTVHGDVLVGRARHHVDGPGWFYDDRAPDPGSVDGDATATVYVPLGDDGYVERRLVRAGATLRWSLDHRGTDR
jgi:hypothetical protein